MDTRGQHSNSITSPCQQGEKEKKGKPCLLLMTWSVAIVQETHVSAFMNPGFQKFFLKVQISKWTYFNRELKESAFAFQCLCASTAPQLHDKGLMHFKTFSQTWRGLGSTGGQPAVICLCHHDSNHWDLNKITGSEWKQWSTGVM